MSIQSNIGGDIGIRWQVLEGAAEDGDQTGAGIDRNQIGSAVISHACGEATGTPDSYTVETSLEHADEDVAEDYVATGLVIATLDTDDTSAYTDVNFGPLKRWVRLVTTVTFTGGDTPTVPVTACVVLGGSAAGSIA